MASSPWMAAVRSPCEAKLPAAQARWAQYSRAGGGHAAGIRPQAGVCDATRHNVCKRVAEALAHGGHGSLVVVGDAALLELAVRRHERVGRAVVLVERHPDASGVHELDPP